MRWTRSRLRTTDREIVRLALPAFLALVAEPLFLLADAAVVGHLGTVPLAALGVAAAVLQTLVGLCVFLAYGTTARVARLLGAHDRRGALDEGLDGVWLAGVIGVGVTLGGITLAPVLVDALGATRSVTGPATAYLRLALLGTTPLLVMLAATGILRGLQDTRTPLVVAVAGNVVNVGLNLLLVYPVGLGLVGSAIGSVVAQALSAAALLTMVVVAARREGASLRPRRSGVRRAARAGVPLLVRTLTLRAAILATVVAVAGLGRGAGDLAAHQLAVTIWTFLAFVLDAVAIAAQAITGRALGAADLAGTRALTRRMVQWGVVSGVVTGLMLAAAAPYLGPLFTGDAGVRDLLVPVLLVAAVGQPLAGVVFVLDGVLIGAGDGRYLAWAGLACLLAYLPLLALAASVGGSLPWVWVAFAGGFMLARGVVLVTRARGEAWLLAGR